jgi:hypothetical protein
VRATRSSPRFTAYAIAAATLVVLCGFGVLGMYDALLALAPAGLLLLSLALGFYVGEDRILRALERLRWPRRSERSLGRARPVRRATVASGRLMAFGWAMRPPPRAARVSR